MRTKTVFDMDNTLIPNKYYADAVDEFVLQMQRIFNGEKTAEEISDLQREIDRKKLLISGFKEDRFALSMVSTYEALCTMMNKPVKEEIKRISYNIGMSVFDEEAWKKNDLLPGVQETLEFLLSKGHELYLLTEGVEKWQKRKIEVTSLRKWFNNEKNNYLCVEGGKNAAHLLQLVNNEVAKSSYVGDKKTRDVSLAVDAGVLPIYIPENDPRDNKFFGENKDDPLDATAIELRSIIELKHRYEEVFQK